MCKTMMYLLTGLNLYSEEVLRELEDMPWFIISDHNLNRVKHEDDAVLIAQTQKGNSKNA